LRQYEMNSNGSIFTDGDGKITYNEYGIYTQLTKKFLKEERLKFTGSIRYDKSQNFDGFVSPRVAFVYSAGASKRHNIRVSYQTGFRKSNNSRSVHWFRCWSIRVSRFSSG